MTRRTRRSLCSAAFLVAAGVAASASAAIVAATERAVVVETTADVALPPARLWPLLLEPARWWPAAQSWSGDARNLTLDARAGGCFCETLPGGGSVEQMRVVRVEPGRMLRMTGGLGPLQADAVTGPLTITLAPHGAGTRLTWRYALAGAGRVPLTVLAPIIDRLIAAQAAALAAFVEARAPDAASSSGTASPPK